MNSEAITLYGASDDLIEVAGAIREEWNCDEPAPREGRGPLVAFSDGTVAAIHYDSDGAWRITIVKRGTARTDLYQCTDPGGSDYSDRLVLEPGPGEKPFEWALFGTAIASAP